MIGISKQTLSVAQTTCWYSLRIFVFAIASLVAAVVGYYVGAIGFVIVAVGMTNLLGSIGFLSVCFVAIVSGVMVRISFIAIKRHSSAKGWLKWLWTFILVTFSLLLMITTILLFLLIWASTL